MDNMYINKGIYTYIPIPDPETPKPEPRWPDPELVFQGTGEQLFGLCPGAGAGGGGGPGNFHLVVAQYPEQLFRLFPG